MVERLMMASTSLWHWDPEKDASWKHKQLLCRLTDTGGRGRAWIWRDSPARTDIDDLKVALDECKLQRDGLGPKALQSHLERLRHHVFVDAERFADVMEIAPTGLPHYVSFDFRLVWRLRRIMCVVSVALWSRLPASAQHRPAGLAGAVSSDAGVRLHDYWELFQGQIIPAAERMLGKHFSRVKPRVFGRRYEPPRFSFVVPAVLEADPLEYLSDRRPSQTDALAAVVLGVGGSRDCVVTSSVINGDLLVLRRFRPVRGKQDRPCYLMIPRYDDAARQETRAQEVISALSELEISAAIELFELNTAMDIWDNHLSVYDAALTRANRIWDGLATHLAVRHMFNLGRVHRAVGLIHQTLLQGFSDLANASNLADEVKTRMEETADQFIDRFDQKLTEHHAPDTPGIRSAFTRTGHFDRLRRRSQRVVEKATRVRSDAQAQVQAIADAFDERRVRETDALQNAGVLIAGVLVLLGWAALVDPGPALAHWVGDLQVKWWLATLATAAVAGIFAWRFHKGPLGSGAYRRLYGDVRKYLKNSSTGTLNDFKRSGPTNADWAAHDTKLSGQFAEVWDDITTFPTKARDDRPKRDIRALSSQLERDSMHLLLITERARALWEYDLPLLTCLYRQCGRLPKSFVRAHNEDVVEAEVNVVAEEDLVLSLKAFHAEEAHELDQWMAAQRPATARQALDNLRPLQLRAGMDREAAETALRHIRLPSAALHFPHQRRDEDAARV